MQVIIAGLLLLIAFTSGAQLSKHGPPCGGMDILEVGVHIKGQKVLQYNGMRYSEISANLLRQGFTVALADSSHKVKWFLIDYEGSSGAKEFPIFGTKATAKNAAFIKAIKPGDQLSLECINIQEAGVTNLSTNFRIIVTN
ncbi:MAG: hypothetical protein EOP49_09680 [Sphingobacteriales bacterium]|nr:MAG: hypothetical protein EOP49_09680 [Sphingobacteriales bacterium]